MTYLLGIDVGTGGTRALILDESGTVIASATSDHAPFASPHTGWAEQDPDDWWRACRQAVPRALEQAGLQASDIVAIGLSGQMHGATLLDTAGAVVRPALIWCDQRTQAECDELTERIGAARLIELTSNPALTGFTLPKLLWVRRTEPDAWARVRHVLLPKDYIRLPPDRADGHRRRRRIGHAALRRGAPNLVQRDARGHRACRPPCCRKRSKVRR